MKVCVICSLEKPLSDFSPNKGGKLGVRSECRQCRRDTKVWRKHWIKRYGISEEEYQTLFLNQNGCCAICGKKEFKSLAVDHDHQTGKVRSLLCSNCNTAIGLVKEDCDILLRMVDYLRKDG